MLQAIHACHSLGFAHRDLKLENVLLDKNFNSKLTDFTFATPI
jgi:serine/threonine protein kinase